jgi:RNA polymerase sigma-70 factor (ECF subfamily)
MAGDEGSDAGERRAELELTRRAHRGDVAAFEALVLRFQRPVHRLCWRMLRSSTAEDLAQETFVRAFVHFDRFDPERPLLPWLLAIARRLCLDLLRRERLMPTTAEIPAVIDPAPGPERQASLDEEVSRVQEALADLDEGPREAILLFHLEAMSYRDIATTLDVPIGTVMTWLHRGRARIKQTQRVT